MTPRLLALVFAVVAGCSSRTSQTPTPMNQQPDTTTATSPSVAQSAPGEWTVRVTRTQATYSATGEIITTDAPSVTMTAPHVRLAAARAWHAIASEALATDANASVAAARAGLDELGKDYRPERGVRDDTTLLIGNADDQLAAGKAEGAARDLMGALASRMKLYVMRYPSVKGP